MSFLVIQEVLENYYSNSSYRRIKVSKYQRSIRTKEKSF